MALGFSVTLSEKKLLGLFPCSREIKESHQSPMAEAGGTIGSFL